MAPAVEHDELRLYALCTKKSWWHVPHLIKLNLLLMIPFLTSYVGGFDGSNLNGLQTLEHWQECQYSARLCCTPSC